MTDISISILKKQLHAVFGRVETGGEMLITSKGKPIARTVPIVDRREQARKQLQALQQTCQVGDLTTPIEIDWNAVNARS